MVIARLIKEKLSSTPAGVVLTTRDFGVEMRYQPALAKALNRLVLQGELQKIAKGKYYIPKKTIFGNLKPADCGLHYRNCRICSYGSDYTDKLIHPCRHK